MVKALQIFILSLVNVCFYDVVSYHIYKEKRGYYEISWLR